MQEGHRSSHALHPRISHSLVCASVYTYISTFLLSTPKHSAFIPQMPPPPSGRPLSGRDVSHKAPAPALQEPSFDSLLVYFKAVHPLFLWSDCRASYKPLESANLSSRQSHSLLGDALISFSWTLQPKLLQNSSRAGAPVLHWHHPPSKNTTQRRKSCATRHPFNHIQ